MDIRYAAPGGENSFEDTHWWIQSRFVLLDRLLTLKHRGRPLSLLDIGCGTGVNLRYLKTHYDSALAEIVGTDPYAVESVQGNVRVSRDIPEGKGFDLILAMDVLEHTDQPLELLK